MQDVGHGNLRNFEWMLDDTVPLSDNEKDEYILPYGDVTKLNSCRLIMDSVGTETLKEIGENAIKLLDTSVAIYEANGDYAFGMFSSGWCRIMDSASRDLCKTNDNREALSCGKWLCHENCWNDSAKKAIETGKSTDIECVGGIHLYAEPIYAGQKVVGVINIGYGDPPKSPDKIKALSESFHVAPEKLKKICAGYKIRPKFIVDVAKKQLSGFAKLIGEIVEKAEAEKDIRKSELFLKSLLGAILIPVFYKDSNGRYLGFNKAFEQFFGKNEEKIVGKTVFEVNPPDLANIYFAKDQELLKSGKGQKYEFQVQNALEDRREVIFNKAVFHDPNGKIGGLIGAIQDITDLRQTERALKKSEEKFRRVYEHMAIGVATVSLEFKIEGANDAYCSMLGYSENELIGKHLKDITHPEILDENMLKQTQLAKGEIDHFRMDKSFIHKRGRIIHGILDANLISDANGKPSYFIGSVLDISDRKRAEEALRNSEETVRKKLQAILEPEGDIGDLDLADIIDHHALQSMMEKFYGLTKIGGAIVDVSGKILASVGWQDICAKFHRVHPETLKNCIESDTVLSSGVSAGSFKRYRCKNNMWDIVTPIEVGGRHLGNIFIGQFFYEGEIPDRELFRNQARRYGFEETEYLAALDRVLSWSRETIDTAMAFYAEIAGLISSLSYSTVKLSRALSQKDVMLRRLAESEERFRVIATYTPDHILIQDKDLRYRYILNPQLGLTKEDMIGKTDFDFLSKEDAAALTVMKKGVLETGEPQFVRVPLTSITGDVQHFEGSYIPKRDQEGKIDGLIGYFRNVTERVEGEEQRKKLEVQLQQAQKMEAIGTSAGGIAHDFNNILGIILGNAELAMDDVPDWNPAKNNLEEVRKACLRAKEVVRQILSFSRKSEVEQKPINIATVVTESLRLIRASIPTSIDIRRNIADDNANIFGDPTQIHQIMINLCTNAAHAMDTEGGILEVDLKNMEIDENAVSQYPELNPGAYVQLRVSDTGDGIPSQMIDRIFDPYFTTKDVDKGTGLGLSVVHGIVNSHHGKILVESKTGKGTIFKILFPAVELKTRQKPTEFQKLPIGTERILFVDDEKSMVNLNQQRLARLGYRVIAKTDPSEALEFFRVNPDQIDLVITDMTMPHMTGDRLAQEILKIKSDTPIILCTGYSNRISKEKAKDLGIRKYIEKPIDMVNLAKSVREVLDGRSIA